MFQFEVLCLALVVASAAGLQSFDNYREGSCMNVPGIAAERRIVDTFRYISAGSKYHMYRMASAEPNYRQIREDEFYYDFCYGRNNTSTDQFAQSFAFGRPLERWAITTRPGIYLEGTPISPSPLGSDSVRWTVTLTDHRTYAFLLSCWTRSNQRSWVLLTATGNLNLSAQRAIQNHAASLGFNRDNFVFLRYDSCQYGIPFATGARRSAVTGGTSTTTRWDRPGSTDSNVGELGWTS